jgi:hypothetical protein
MAKAKEKTTKTHIGRNVSRRGSGIDRQAEEMLRLAKQLAEKGDTWTQVHNALFGVGGETSRRFPSEKERLAFAKTPEYKKIWGIIEALQGEGDGWWTNLPRAFAASGNISLRLPQALHAALMNEAEQEGVSLNQLCLAKLAVQLREAVCQ